MGKFAWITVLGLGIGLSCHAAEILHVKKSEAKCTAPNVCTDPSYLMDCSFQDNGTVEISKFYITNFAFPALPIPAPYAFVGAADLARIKSDIAAMPMDPSLKGTPVAGRTYSFAGNDYAASDLYTIPTSGESVEVADYFMSSGEVSAAPVAAPLVELADKYCAWSFLTLETSAASR